MPAMRAFYKSALKPLGYSEMIVVSESYVGFGSDYPYLWLKALPEGKASVPTHLALDTPGMWRSNESYLYLNNCPEKEGVDQFFKLALLEGGIDNGAPSIRAAMSVQPYYAAFVLDPDGNNLEAVNIPK